MLDKTYEKIKNSFEREMLLWIAFVSLVCYAYYTFSYYYYYQAHSYAYFLIFMTVLQIGCLTQYLKNNTYELCAKVNFVMSYTSINVLVIAAGGIRAPGVFWYLLIPFVGFCLFGRRYVRTLIAITFVPLTILVAFELFSPLATVIPPEKYNLAKVEGFTTFMVIGFLLMNAYSKLVHQSEKAIKEKNREIDTLLKMVIHDISSPLQVIMFLNRGLKKELPDHPQVERIGKSLENIEEIISNVKFTKSFSEDRQIIKEQSIPISELIQKTKDNFEHRLDEKGLALKITNPDNPVIKTDANVFCNQILNNILSNAIKFSPRGASIDITIHKNSDAVIVNIRDYGVGMDKDMLNKIIGQQDVQSSEGTEGERGTGFGTQLIFDSAKLLGIRITLQSTNEGDDSVRGTTYSLTLAA